MSSAMPRVAVLGLGGVGGVISAALGTSGRCRLSCVVQGAGLERLRSEGLRVRLFEGSEVHCRPQQLLNAKDLSSWPLEVPHDVVFLCTKSHQLPSTIPALSRLLGPATMVVPCVNGLPFWYGQLESVDAGGQLRTAVCKQRIIGTVGFISGERGGDKGWFSKWPSERNRLVLGDLEAGGGRSARTDFLESLFDAAGPCPVRIEAAEDIRSAVFEKLLINCSLNPISCLTRLDCGGIVARPVLRKLLSGLVEEAKAVGRSLKPPPRSTLTAEQIMEIYDGQSGLKTSMLQDLEAGRALERAAIVGALVEAAAQQGVEVPLLRAMDAMLSCSGRSGGDAVEVLQPREERNGLDFLVSCECASPLGTADPGARQMALELAYALSAPAVLWKFSRLCDDVGQAMLKAGLSGEERRQKCWLPYDMAIGEAIGKLGPGFLMVSVRSFDSVEEGEVGLWPGDEGKVASAVLHVLRDAGYDARIRKPAGCNGLIFGTGSLGGQSAVLLQFRTDKLVSEAWRKKLLPVLVPALEAANCT